MNEQSQISRITTLPKNTTFTSWKEVAAYLGKGVRTVQRWESQFGLPVRRPQPRRHVIFALPQELDAWVKQQQFKARRPSPLIAARRMQHQQLANGLKTRITRLQENQQTLEANIVRLRRLRTTIAGRNASTGRDGASRLSGTAA